MTNYADDFICLPLVNTVNLCENLLAQDLVFAKNNQGVEQLSPEHNEARAMLVDIFHSRPHVYGKPDSDAANNIVVPELAGCSKVYLLANFSYCVGSCLQFLLAVQINPIYKLDSFLRVGKVEKQAKFFSRWLEELVERYRVLYPKDFKDSYLVKYGQHLQPALERISISDMFNPIHKECIQLERLRDLADGQVTISGIVNGWIVRDRKGQQVARNVDGGLAIMEAIAGLQYGR